MESSEAPTEVVLIVDIANVMGSRPDGWWRDKAAAAHRLLGMLQSVDTDVALPDATGPTRISSVVAVLEGVARRAEGPKGVVVRRAERDGDTEIVEEARRQSEAGRVPLVVTADRGLRARLPPTARYVGPGWLNGLLGR